ncbi:MAG TPA: hypothetical protein VEY89_08590, partial [Candidatus Dormibacteraeota bacterium]|nr:hypothetical protein [Candidatus Dormibacteraeota bacterium]
PRAFGLLVMSSVLVSACASSRLIRNPSPPAANVAWAASAPEGLTVEVHQLIFRNSGGSWVRDANWDEYVLTIRNDSQGTFDIQAIRLYSDKLPTPVESSTSLEQLEARSNSTLRALKDAGIIGGVGIVAPAAMIVGGVGTGGLLGMSSAGAAAAAIGVVAIPVGLIGGTAYVINRRRRDKDDKVLIERTLTERGFVVPLQIVPGTQLEKSAFFPVTPAPNRLVVTEMMDGKISEVAVELPALARLHLKPRHSPDAMHNSPGAPN